MQGSGDGVVETHHGVRYGDLGNDHATGAGLVLSKVVSEVGSGLNGRRMKLLGLLRDPGVRGFSYSGRGLLDLQAYDDSLAGRLDAG